MRKIVIYEPIHLDWVIPYAELMAQEPVAITFITSVAFKKNLEASIALSNNYKWHFINPFDSIPKFSRCLFSILRQHKFDLLILNSIDFRHFIVFVILLLAKPQKILINLHDVNNFLLAKPSLRIRTNIRAAGKKLLTFLADGYIVNARSMKDYILNNKLTAKPVYWLPPVYYKPPVKEAASGKLTIIIPGTIDKRRRDYELVLALIENILKLQKNVTWILAGKPDGVYGQHMLKKAEKLKEQGADIIFFEDEVPEKEFQHLMAASTMIFSPLVLQTSIHDRITETYGISKVSGNIYDAIRHGKPLIIPGRLKVPEEIKSGCFFYTSLEDLTAFIRQVTVSHELIHLAEKNSLAFSREAIQNRFTNTLNQ